MAVATIVRGATVTEGLECFSQPVELDPTETLKFEDEVRANCARHIR
jgi:hypothetical protein